MSAENDGMVRLIPNVGEQYAEPATDGQRALLYELCLEDGIDPELLAVRAKSQAKQIISAWLGRPRSLQSYEVWRHGKCVLRIPPPNRKQRGRRSRAGSV